MASFVELESIPRRLLLRRDKKLNRIVRLYLEGLIRSLVKNYSQYIDSIILIGSLAKSEGSAGWFNNYPILLSDYDLVLILNISGFLTFKFKSILGRTCWSYIEPPLQSKVDISLMPRFKLRKLPPTFEFIDWKYVGKVVYGDHKVLELLEKVDISKIDEKSLQEVIKKRIDDLRILEKIKIPTLLHARMLIKSLFSLVEWIVYKEENIYTPYLKEKFRMLQKIGNYTELENVCNIALRYLAYPEKVSFPFRDTLQIVKKYYLEIFHNVILEIWNKD